MQTDQLLLYQSSLLFSQNIFLSITIVSYLQFSRFFVTCLICTGTYIRCLDQYLLFYHRAPRNLSEVNLQFHLEHFAVLSTLRYVEVPDNVAA